MIYKVFYQETTYEAPVREHTKSLFMEADSERTVRATLKKRNYNIEFIQEIDGNYLEYEKQNENFKVLEQS